MLRDLYLGGVSSTVKGSQRSLGPEGVPNALDLYCEYRAVARLHSQSWKARKRVDPSEPLASAMISLLLFIMISSSACLRPAYRPWQCLWGPSGGALMSASSGALGAALGAPLALVAPIGP